MYAFTKGKNQEQRRWSDVTKKKKNSPVDDRVVQMLEQKQKCSSKKCHVESNFFIGTLIKPVLVLYNFCSLKMKACHIASSPLIWLKMHFSLLCLALKIVAETARMR